jgi:hypothetical protein
MRQRWAPPWRDDLDASADDSAPAHWALTENAGDPPLPSGVRPLIELVEAAASLATVSGANWRCAARRRP